MQDTLWCCRERILPRKVWRIINYEIEVMQYKDVNQMSAYYLGQAIGQSILGPADCDTIMTEKASHFLTRMIIEHSKNYKSIQRGIHKANTKKKTVAAADYANARTISSMSKSEATRAKAKSYNRIIRQIHNRNRDWLAIANQSLYAMLENDYEENNARDIDEPYVSIFSTDLDPSRAITSPVLYKLVSEASKPIEVTPRDPFANSTLFSSNNGKSKAKSGTPPSTTTIESQLSIAFDDFAPLTQENYLAYLEELERNSIDHHQSRSHMRMINTSLSQMKLKLKKDRSPFAAAPMPPLPPSTTNTAGNTTEKPTATSAISTIIPHDTINHRRSKESIAIPSSPNTAASFSRASSTIEEEADFYNADQQSHRTLYTNSIIDEHMSNSSSSSNNNMKTSRKQMKGMMRKAFKLGTIVPSKRIQAGTTY
ncbi:hypothetical protein BDF20DRAFT_829671 [Mycotypha africana]|uniref:uncharacterized protein n=1 Tax=Mycotypha africana TaxID=64632 RepID=UPI002301F720|nr:uncharacterized protein BDF20DRAFT_829671 [Mycotypha africana]KAI8967404.1 hypothetical protein BDF20DRAFT_829671 [Mycotypha africana]